MLGSETSSKTQEKILMLGGTRTEAILCDDEAKVVSKSQKWTSDTVFYVSIHETTKYSTNACLFSLPNVKGAGSVAKVL